MARPALRIAILTAPCGRRSRAPPGRRIRRRRRPRPRSTRPGAPAGHACGPGPCCPATPARARRRAALRRLPGGRRPHPARRPAPGRAQGARRSGPRRPGRGDGRPTGRPTPAGWPSRGASRHAVPGRVPRRPRHVTVRALEARPGDRGRPVRILQRALRRRHYVVGRRGTLRRPHRPRGDGLPQGRRPGAHRRRHARRLPAPRARPGRLPRPLPAARPARRGRPLAPGPRARRAGAGCSASTRRRRAPRHPDRAGALPRVPQDPGTNAKGMVDSNYFIRGYAIHGYASVPVFNASHGCLRVPVPDARRSSGG